MRRPVWIVPLLLSLTPLLAEGEKPAYAPAARIVSEQIRECSGLVASRRHKGIFWTHNDSGDSPRFFAIRADGTLVATYAVEGAGAVDWEDIALDDKGFLYLADIGNNRRSRKDLKIYKVAEPDPAVDGPRNLQVAETLDVAYPEGDFNSEALCVDGSGELLIITKDPKPTAIYRYAGKGWTRLQTLDFPHLVTGADLGPDGRLALATYIGIRILERSPGKEWKETQFILSELKQCEAICWNGPELLLANEEGELFRLDPRRFGPRDAYLPERKAWDPKQRQEVVPIDSRGRPSRLRLTFEPREDGGCRISAHVPEGVQGGKILVLFSREDPWSRPALDATDSAWIVEHANGKIWQACVDPSTLKPMADAPAAQAGLQGDDLELVLPASFYGAQRALAVCVQGYDGEPGGWPFAFWRIRDKPFMWARKAP